MAARQQTWMQVKTWASSEWGGWKNGIRLTFKKRFFLFSLKEKCPHLRILLPRPFWQHFSILPGKTWACHFFFSLGGHIWPSPVEAPPSPSLIHKNCYQLCEPFCSLILGNTKTDWYTATDLAGFSLWTLQCFWVMLMCTHTNTPQREDKVNEGQSFRWCSTDWKFYQSSQAVCRYLFELKWSCKVSQKRENLS